MTRYRVLAPSLFYPASPAFDEQLRAAADLPADERQHAVEAIAKAGGFTQADQGAIVTDLPEASLPWLLEQHLIEVVAPAAAFGLADTAEKTPALGDPPVAEKAEDHG